MRSSRRAAPSDHFDGRRFFDPSGSELRSFGDFLRWRFTSEKPVWPEWIIDEAGPLPPAPPRFGEVAATFVGHATFLLRLGGFAVLTDPIFSLRASPFASLGPKRIRAPAYALEALPKIDAICLSHNHYDHMDLPSVRALQAHSNPVIVTGVGNGAYLASRGIANVIELDWWASAEPLPGLKVTYVPAQHWSRRRSWDTNRMLWGGHVVEAQGARAYFAGDTGYPAQFAEIGRRCGVPDIALLPIGGYEPRWFMAPQHMNPEEAVRAHLDLGARLSIAMHFATFRLTDEAFGAPEAALEAARAQLSVPADAFRVPAFGETIAASQ
ncbi:MAG TPA: MBL fold metallo-hydrolase [Stellaceae bacterium]|jgi:L-ascorbate metabolism protein UlaG (beta-lactamase superfamily)|nr:MBL fold metallo-hydrolase [Stellaceae bacterium]